VPTQTFVPKYGFSSDSEVKIAGLGVGAFAGIVAGVVVLSMLIAFIVIRKARASKFQAFEDEYSTSRSSSISSSYGFASSEYMSSPAGYSRSSEQ
jgi:hypothetical protein